MRLTVTKPWIKILPTCTLYIILFRLCSPSSLIILMLPLPVITCVASSSLAASPAIIPQGSVNTSQLDHSPNPRLRQWVTGIGNFSWDNLEGIRDVNNQHEVFTSRVFCMLDTDAPQKTKLLLMTLPGWMLI